MILNGELGFKLEVALLRKNADVDIDWQVCLVKVLSSTFSASYETNIASSELLMLSGLVRKMPVREFAFETMEEGLKFLFQPDVTGNTTCIITCKDDRNVLTCETVVDYSSMQQFVRSIEEDIDRFA